MTARACGSCSPAALSSPVKPPRGHHLDPPAPGLAPSGEPGREELPGPARDHVQKPGRTTAVAHGGQVDDDGDTALAPPGAAPHRGAPPARERSARGNRQLREPPSLNRSGASLRTCPARVRTALSAVCQDIPRAAAARDTDTRSRARGPQPPLHRRACQPRPGLSQAAHILPPRSTAAGAGQAPHAYHQLHGPPPHRHVGQAPGHRPAGYSLSPAGLAERILTPDRHAALHNGSRQGREPPHRGHSQGVQPQEDRQTRAGEGSLRHVEVSVTARAPAPTIGTPRPLPKQRRTPTYAPQ